ncbi:hypothetical protein [Metamycoplasma neophronis]|uniref:DUF4064 domain-containing protein n=1 Tax=Metamycoplasma neophronis TaxID=872983 RepID=A0ABY2Z0Q9_9BACT|nr:hypothetical protein [Metamycoplasma neophronis]TPR54737.1 hypothetical protein FJR74_00490 [Metamycoplasma neophronis]
MFKRLSIASLTLNTISLITFPIKLGILISSIILAITTPDTNQDNYSYSFRNIIGSFSTVAIIFLFLIWSLNLATSIVSLILGIKLLVTKNNEQLVPGILLVVSVVFIGPILGIIGSAISLKSNPKKIEI